MKIAIVANGQEKSKKIEKELKVLIADTNAEIEMNSPDIVITVGGDGTLLSAFHQYAHLLDKVRFVGIHTGHLGFYTDWRDYELAALVESLSKDQGNSVSYPLLEVHVTYGNNQQKKYLALNESTIRNVNRTMVTDIFIKEELFEVFRGDGLSIATPTGSTAYNKSVGGAVLHPRINALQLTEIASLNNRVYRTLGSPVVIPSDEWIQLKLSEHGEYLLTIDQLNFKEQNIKKIVYKIAKERIHFASYRHTHFWLRVRDAFICDSKVGEALE
ncbi:NAD kinase [Vagococcus entomophilus]|uniref:NAD kinase n=1 Tax=Vagococcus entomophilus TaxID=1160095 RepID=A0A430AL74_9ENTE|nr:NAD kinase [Vagococcus entomophilus]RSU08724.1 NAD kinase [Vagococcus entomophilus]